MASGANYKVLPLPVVQKWAKHELSREQLRAGINLARKLRLYPHVPDLSIGPCGDGMELRIKHPLIGKQGWLRAIFWIDEKAKTIYIVDLFWKKENESDCRSVARRSPNPRAESEIDQRRKAVELNYISSVMSTPKAFANFCNVFCCGICSPDSNTVT